MKTLKFGFMALLAIGFTGNAAQAETVETVVTCQQDDGDQWVEAGIVLNDGPGLRVLVVEHNLDDHTSKLVASRQVFSKRQGKLTIYQDSHETVRLVVEKKKGRIEGSLVVLQDGPGSFSQSGLYCYEKSDISFDK